MATALVLGAYGLIGSACVKALQQNGFSVTGMGRSHTIASRSQPSIDWIIADLTRLSVEEWRTHLDGIDVIINAAGALQDGASDSLQAIHDTSIKALCDAAAGSNLRLVQISAAGVSVQASTDFFRSKARGDAHVQSSDLDWVILRPALVVGPGAYGGTALLRGLAGLPGIGVRAFPGTPIQTISMSELVETVAHFAIGRFPMQRVYELAEPANRDLPDTVALIRSWLGLAPARWQLPVPGFLMRCCALVADGLGWLGWRSPIRSTALRTIKDGITADTTAWREAGGNAFGSLPETLRSLPSTLQERWFARLFLMLPVTIALLSLFWLVSGIVGFAQFDRAVAVLTERGFSAATSQLAVLTGSTTDVLLGALVLHRRWARLACLGMVAVSATYVIGAARFAGDLWLDPLGPMVKVIPSIGLALIAWAMLEKR